MKRIVGIVIFLLGLLVNAHAVPPILNYAGQVTVNGEAFDGAGLFKFALVNTDGNVTYWSNDGTSVDGSEPQTSVSVAVNGGLYAVLLGNTAQQGMGPIDPSIFAQHTDAKLRVWFSDGVNGFQQLSPDRLFASVPYAFSAGTAQTASSATIAPGSIDRSMLSGDIRSDLNRTISYQDLSPQIKADINATIGLNRLSSEVISKLEQNATITYGSVTGSKMADGAITADKLNGQILKYLKPEITLQPQASTIYAEGDGSVTFLAEGKYLTYQWKKDGVDLAGETNANFNITDANATLHDGNYSVVVSNDFGSVESVDFVLDVNITWSTDGLTAWYPFDGNASDMSGNGGHGLIVGAQTTQDRFQKTGKAYFLDGQNDRIRINHEALNNRNAFSILMWLKYEQGSTHFFSAANGTKDNEFLLAFNQANKLNLFSNRSGGGGGTSHTSSFSTIGWQSNWIQLGLTRNNPNSQIKVYFNGDFIELFSVANGVLNISQNGLWIGADQDSVGGGWQAGNYYHGSIDDVRIYDRTLSAEEVQALFKMGQ